MLGLLFSNDVLKCLEDHFEHTHLALLTGTYLLALTILSLFSTNFLFLHGYSIISRHIPLKLD